MKRIYARVPVLKRDDFRGDDGNWGIEFSRMYDMSNDSGLFRTYAELRAEGWAPTRDGRFERNQQYMVPLYEGKMVHHYNARYATCSPAGVFRDTSEAELAQLDFVPLSRYWVPEGSLQRRLPPTWRAPWLFGFRNIGRNTDDRTFICGIVPRTAVGNNFPLLLPTAASSAEALTLVAILSSFTLDFVARLKVGGTTLNFFYVKQFAVPALGTLREAGGCGGRSLIEEIASRTRTLLAEDARLAQALGVQPHSLMPAQRMSIRAELEALVAGAYGLERQDLEFVFDSFPIARRKEEALYGEWRTKVLALEAMDGAVGAVPATATTGVT